MHPAMIQAALKVAGVSQAEIARRVMSSRPHDDGPRPVSSVAVHSVIWGRTRSQNIENAIAAATGIRLAELWPQWHDEKFIQRARKQAIDGFRTAAVG